MTAEQIESLLKTEGVKAILLQFSDLTGRIKVVEIEAYRFQEAVDKGIWYDGSSVAGHARIYESDMLLKPDLGTFAILPWTNTDFKAARLICDIYTTDQEQFESDPRFILKKTLQEAAALGFNYYTAAELEFFLFEKSELPQRLAPHDHKGYFDYTPGSRAFRICRRVMDSLQAFNIKGEAYHHEVAEGQHEIDTRYDLALKSADNILTIKSAIKAYANGESLKATFMPKPLKGINGSGMHIHQSLFLLKGNETPQNAFFSADDKYQLSETAYQFIAGQLRHVKALTAITNPSVNSYKRLVPGYEAPVNICWGRINRSALIRVPKITKNSPASTRTELRNPDPTANPYLAFAGMLACGLDGIKNKLTPPAPVEENLYQMSEQDKLNKNIATLPDSLQAAMAELDKNEVLKNLLGQHTLTALKAAAARDIDQARQEVTPWEISRYL